ncbi:MAG: tripartite tricarboxylate transporter TctB family protein [Vicinamibacterales bacterium]
MTRDKALGIVLLGVATVYYLAARAIPASDLADVVGPRGLPTAYAAGLALLSVLLLVRRESAHAKAGPVVSPAVLARVLGLLVIGVLYILLVPWVGYPVAIAGLLIGTSYYQGGRLDRRVVLVGISGAIVLWLVFVQVLGIDHPVGAWLERLLGEA